MLPKQHLHQHDRHVPYEVDFQAASTTKYHPEAIGVQQVVINVSDNNLVKNFPEEHVEFIDRLKNVRRSSAGDDDSDGEDRSKNQMDRSSTSTHVDSV